MLAGRGAILSYKNALSTYKETRIKTAGQGQLIIMLYDAGVQQLDQALELMHLNETEKKDPARIEKIGKAVVKTQEIIAELMASLDFEEGGDIAKNLFSLYAWFNRELLEGNMKQDIERIASIRNMIEGLRGAWQEIAASSVSEAANHEVAGISITM